MPESIGLVIFAVGLAIMAVLLIQYFRTREKVETDAAFAQERGWTYRDVLPQFGQAQRQHVFSPAEPGPLPWELVISMAQPSSSGSVPTTSTVWHSTQVYLERGACVVGPALPQGSGPVDLSSPILRGFLQLFLGDAAQDIADLQPVALPGFDRLTVLATDPELAAGLLGGAVVERYSNWLEAFPGEDTFPVLLLSERELQFKARKALTLAREADAFVEFCVGVAECLQQGS